MFSTFAWLLVIAVITYYLVHSIFVSGSVKDVWTFVDVLFPLFYISIVAAVGSGILTFVRTWGKLSWSEYFKVFPKIALLFSIIFLGFYHFPDIFGESNEHLRASNAECTQVKTGEFETQYVEIQRYDGKQTQRTKIDNKTTVYTVKWPEPCIYTLIDSTDKLILTAHILSVQRHSYQCEIQYGDTTWIQEISILK